jgi:hypothetical protein
MNLLCLGSLSHTFLSVVAYWLKHSATKLEGRGFETQWVEWILSIYLILPAVLGPGVYSASNRNDYQKETKCLWVVERIRCVRLTISLSSMSRLSRQCGILNISLPYRPLRPITGMALLFYVGDVRTSQETYILASMASYGDSFTFLCVVDIRTSQETCLWPSMACYGDSFTFLCVDYVRTSQNTRLWTSTWCHAGSFTILYVDVRASQGTHLWASTACCESSLLFYM